MMTSYTLNFDDDRAVIQNVGGKGAALTEMARANLPVPVGFHVTTAAYEAFVAENDLASAIAAAVAVADSESPASLETASRTIEELFTEGEIPPDVAGAIANAYAGLPGSSPVVAVRSSATAEDLPDASFAGQQESFLNIEGAAPVLDAVRRCWASLWTARAIGYRARRQIGTDGLSLAVVVQCLVPAEVAGILFTANPVNGRRNEAVINAAWGLGEAVVGGQVTPDTYTVDKESGRVIEREIAEKKVLTVRVDGGTQTQPVDDDLRRAPALTDEQAASLVAMGVRVEELFGDPRDIEWGLADGTFKVLQARPITALPEPMAEPPESWPLPDPEGHYMRTSIIDVMPDPLSPLFVSMALPAIGEGLQRTLDEMIGGSLSLVENYVVTINDYAYISARFTARDLWWSLVRMLPVLPRLLNNAARHWEEVALPRYRQAVVPWEAKDPESMGACELLEGAQTLTEAMGRYLTTLQIDTLGIAAGTEMLFTRIYDKLVKQEGDPPAATYLLGTDSLPIQADKALYDLAVWCRGHDDLSAYVKRTRPADLAERLSRREPPETVATETWTAWRERFNAHLEAYGHSIYDLDFAKPIPAHDPTPLLQTLKVFIRDDKRNPYARQQRLLDRREEAMEKLRDRVGRLRWKVFDKTHGWARKHTRLREDSIAGIGLAYPSLRSMLLELGQRLSEVGAVSTPEDVFWLEQREVRDLAEAIEPGKSLESLDERVRARKRQRRAEKRVTPPAQLPKKERVLGIKTDVFLPTSEEGHTDTTLSGIGCSPGRVTGTARILHGPEDFDQMEADDILVADITTPAWTPLFAIASGIVTDVGGPLSHGSIVAREYGIPAVLGTGVATKRIESGMAIIVDGDAGTVTLQDA